MDVRVGRPLFRAREVQAELHTGRTTCRYAARAPARAFGVGLLRAGNMRDNARHN